MPTEQPQVFNPSEWDDDEILETSSAVDEREVLIPGTRRKQAESDAEEDEHEEEKDVTMEEKEKGQDGQGKENEGGTSETYVIRCLTDTNIIAQCRHDVQIRPQETTTYAHRIL